MRSSVRALLALAGLACGTAGTEAPPVDLVIDGAAVLDVQTGEVAADRAVVVDGGRIVAVVPRDEAPRASRRIEAAGGLVTPGLVDVHHHTAFVLGDSVTPGGGFVADLSMEPDSIAAYRERFARAYLPHGVTTVRDAGSDERHMPMLVAWTERSPDAPDFHPVGGALISPPEEGSLPYAGHAVVEDSVDARRRVRAYAERGIEHVKLYWRLREPEFAAALDEARRRGMHVTGHVDFKVLGFDTALDLGLTSFEHAYTVAVGALTREEYLAAWREVLPEVVGDRSEGRFYLGVLAYLHVLEPDDPRIDELLDRLVGVDATVVPTLHIFAQRIGLAPHVTPPVAKFDDLTWLDDEQRAWAVEGYRRLADLVRRMHERGIDLAVGTDWTEPGLAVLSEMTLFHDAGIPMDEVVRIATLGGAEAIGVAEEIGTIEPGKRANLVVFERDPLADPAALFGAKTVIKDGVVAAP